MGSSRLLLVGVCPGVVVAVVIALSFGASRGATAQADELLILDHIAPPTVLGAPRAAGSARTLHTFPGQSDFWSMVAGPGDDSVYLIGAIGGTTTVRAQVQVSPRGSATLTTFTTPSGFPTDASMDDAGDLELLWYGGGTGNGIYSMPVGSPVLTKRVGFPAGLPTMLAYTEDRATGGWYVFGGVGHCYLHHVSPNGSVQASIMQLVLAMEGHYGVTSDPLTGDLLYAYSQMLFRVDLASKTVKTVSALGSMGMTTHDICFDQRTRGYWVVANIYSGSYQGVTVRVSEQGVVVSSSTRTGPRPFVRTFRRIRPAFGRVFTPLNAPVRGATHALKLRCQWEPGSDYRVAAAFHYLPGIVTPAGTIPICPDPLFFTSLAGGPLFRNFAGKLDANGGAVIGLDIPNHPGLEHVRVHLAAVSFDAKGIRSILGPHSFTIR